MLRTSGTLNKCVGQYINAFLKKKRKIERESQRKWGGGAGWLGCCREDKRGSETVCESGNSIITVPWQ